VLQPTDPKLDPLEQARSTPSDGTLSVLVVAPPATLEVSVSVRFTSSVENTGVAVLKVTPMLPAQDPETCGDGDCCPAAGVGAVPTSASTATPNNNAQYRALNPEDILHIFFRSSLTRDWLSGQMLLPTSFLFENNVIVRLTC